MSRVGLLIYKQVGGRDSVSNCAGGTARSSVALSRRGRKLKHVDKGTRDLMEDR